MPQSPDADDLTYTTGAGMDQVGQNRRLRTGMRRLVTLGVLCTVCLLSAEMTCRVDDWLRSGISLLASPHENDLTINDYFGKRGRPGARFRKWQLNQFGFRGQEISLEPSATAPRIMILGSSEAFGLYESPGCEFPALLAAELRRTLSCEVVNASLPGMTISSMVTYWEHWAAQFQPRIVVIYPAPQFYLAEPPPKRKSLPPQAHRMTGVSPKLSSRFGDRLKDLFEFPAFIQRERDRRRIRKLLDEHPADWTYQVVPLDRVALYIEHVDALVRAIRTSGAQPVLVTHSMRVTSPPGKDNLEELEAARVHIPRATAEVIASFETATNDALSDYAREQQLPILDADRHLSGRRELFADLVHFTDAGAAVMAELVAAEIQRLSQGPSAGPDHTDVIQ